MKMSLSRRKETATSLNVRRPEELGGIGSSKAVTVQPRKLRCKQSNVVFIYIATLNSGNMKCETTLKNGLEKIAETRRPGMVIIHKSTCSACNNLRPRLLASKEIDRLSASFVVISLMDENEPKDHMWGFDGRYFPRIFFLDPNGQIMKQINNEDNSKYKYYYSSEKSLIRSMEKVLMSYPNGGEAQRPGNTGGVTHRMRMTNQAGMIIIYKTWCPVCSELKAVLASSREIDYLSNYIVIVLLKDEDEPTDRAFSPDGSYIPRIFFLNPTGNIMYDVFNSRGDPRGLKPKFEASKDIENLSSGFVLISLADDNQPKEEKYMPDGDYVPRILFLSPQGVLLVEVINEVGSSEYKYFYSDAESIARSMKTVLMRYPEN